MGTMQFSKGKTNAGASRAPHVEDGGLVRAPLGVFNNIPCVFNGIMAVIQ
jgi:hypothetical protein